MKKHAKPRAKRKAEWTRLGISKREYLEAQKQQQKFERALLREAKREAPKLKISVEEYLEAHRQAEFEQEFVEVSTGADDTLREQVRVALGKKFHAKFWADLRTPIKVWCDFLSLATDDVIEPPGECSAEMEQRLEYWSEGFWHELVLSDRIWGFISHHIRDKRTLAFEILKTWEKGLAISKSQRLLVHYRNSDMKITMLRKKEKRANRPARASVRENYIEKRGRVYDQNNRKLSREAEKAYWSWKRDQEHKVELEKIRKKIREKRRGKGSGVTTAKRGSGTRKSASLRKVSTAKKR